MKSWLMAVAFFLAIGTAIAGIVVTLLREDEPHRSTPVARHPEAEPRATPERVGISPPAVLTPDKSSSRPQPPIRRPNDDEARPETPRAATPPAPAEDRRSVNELVTTMLATATKDERQFKLAMQAFQRKGIEAAPAALELLRTSDVPLIRRMMVYSMQEMIGRDPTHADQLRSMFLGPIANALESDSDVLTRRWAASALGVVRGRAALDALAATLRKEDREFGVEYWAISSLQNFIEPETFDAIEALATDGTFPSEARQSAVAGMGACIAKNPFLLPRLAPLLRDEELRDRVLAALRSLGTPEALAMIESAPKVEPPPRPIAEQPETVIRQESPPDADARTTFEGIRQNLAGLPFRDRIPTYESHLFSPSSNRTIKRMILGEVSLGGVDTIPLILRVVREDADLAVKVTAIEHLGSIGTAETAKELERIQRNWSQYSSDPVPKGTLDNAREAIYSRTVTSE